MQARTSVADIDNYSPCTRLMNTAMYLLTFYESSSLVAPLRNYVRGRGLKAAEAYMEKEDLQTNYICIGEFLKSPSTGSSMPPFLPPRSFVLSLSRVLRPG